MAGGGHERASTVTVRAGALELLVHSRPHTLLLGDGSLALAAITNVIVIVRVCSVSSAVRTNLLAIVLEDEVVAIVDVFEG